MRAIVVTSISKPNPVLRVLAEESLKRGYTFILAGDTKSPADFHIPGCEFLSIEQQRSLFPRFASILPERHYCRKNIAYLRAIEQGATAIQETDDDNMPLEAFWGEPPQPKLGLSATTSPGWLNVYRWFTDQDIWPRGLPLENIQDLFQPRVEEAALQPLIFQGLANDNPDVDAVFRLTRQLPFTFDQREAVLLHTGTWCPFNSQNTLFRKEAFMYLYLPATCSFRMTDIWRSFIAQRCLWQNQGGIVFHNATVVQARNEHSLIKDFEDEVPGYLNNNRIIRLLAELELSGEPGADLFV